MRVKASNSKVKPAPAVETSESINEQIAAFLKSGGEIQKIEKGVSGQTSAWARSKLLARLVCRAKPALPSLQDQFPRIDERRRVAAIERYACTRLDRAFLVHWRNACSDLACY